MKKINGHRLSRVLFLIAAGALFLPAIQMQFRIFEVKPLNGAVEQIESPTLSSKTWFNETYQSDIEKFLNQNFGFRNNLVRIYNQLAFWFYDKTTARNVVIGRQNYLYEENYIRAYYGRDYIGDSLIVERVKRLKAIQDVLAKSGKLLVVAIAPGKAQFYPEYIPTHLKSDKAQTNYDTYLKEIISQGVNMMDLNRWFLSMKDTSAMPLYPKTGIHWSHYGADLFIDSLISFIEYHQDIDLPEYNVSAYALSEDYQVPDTDVEDGMNLFFTIDNFPMPYATIEVNQKGKTKPKIMVVADSFFWQLYSLDVMSTVFDDGEFWYYNRQIFEPSRLEATPVMMVDCKKKVLEKDVVVLLTTDANLRQFPWEFDERIYDELVVFDEQARLQKKQKIEEIIQTIRNSEDWYGLIVTKANDRGITIDSMLKVDATFIYERGRDKYE